MATPRLGLVVEDKPTELSCVQKLIGVYVLLYTFYHCHAQSMNFIM